MRSTDMKTFLLIIGTVAIFNLGVGDALVSGGRLSSAENSLAIVQVTVDAAGNESDELITQSPASVDEISFTTAYNDSSTSLSTTTTSTTASTTSGSGSAAAAVVQEEPDYLNSIESSPLVLNYTLQKELRIEAIKQEILNRLGMTRVPDVSRMNMTVQERRQILRLYMKSIEELHGKTASTHLLDDDDQFYANQFRSFTEYGDKPVSVSDRLWRPSRGKRIFFAVDIPEPALDHRKETIVKSATLKLFKREVRPQNLAISDSVDRSLRIEVHQILQLSPERFLRRSIDSRLVSLDKTGWEEFDISKAVQDWIRDPSSNLGIEVSCDVRYRMEDLLEFVVWSPSVADNPLLSGRLPALNVLTQEKRILGRQKRNLPERNDCVRGDGEERCCRFPLTIRFRDINWHDWVIEPESYQAYYCEGTCPANYKVAHRFARMKMLMRERNPGLSLSVGCKEARMGSLNIAHYNSEGVLVVSVFENMFPLECLCG